MLELLSANQDATFHFYAVFLQEVVRESPTFFAGLAALGELALGVSLCIGAKVRYSAPIGVFMLFNFMLVKGVYPWQLGADQILSLLLILQVISNSGLVWGLDGHFLKNAAK